MIENLVNGKIYVGKHSTSNLDDGYMGSGVIIQRAIKKHGKEKFYKHIIEIFESADEALEYEKSLITEEFVQNTQTYNLKRGGLGGWEHIDTNARRKGALTSWQNKSTREKRLFKIKEFYHGTQSKFTFKDHKHTKEFKQKIGKINSSKQKGCGNSQFGTMWIYHPKLKQNKKVKKEELNKWLTQGWVKGRKIKFV